MINTFLQNSTGHYFYPLFLTTVLPVFITIRFWLYFLFPDYKLFTMISIITCSQKELSWDIHQRNVQKTAGSEIEYIRIDNRSHRYNLCSAYNEGVRRAAGDILVFMHEDVFFVEGGWAQKLTEKFSEESLGLIGVAGTQYLFADNPAWVAAGRPFVKGQVIHELNQGSSYFLTVFNWQNEDTPVVAVDGLFFAIRRSLFERIRFDDVTFDGFHFYDIDICMQVAKSHLLKVTTDILVKHLSGGSFNQSWKMYASRFIKKYYSVLPVCCTSTTPDLSRRIPFENFDLKGKAPQVTIC